MTYDPLVPLSPFERIEAINRIAGRATGPAPGGYVDENGTPIVPDWSGAGEHQVVGGEPPLEASVNVDAGVAEAAADRGDSEAEVAPALPVSQWNLVMLESGDGVWREQSFTLSAAELLRVRRVVVAAIRRGLREQGRALGAELAPRRKSVRKRKPRQSMAELAGEV